MEKYEGDFRCASGEDSRCRRVATKVYREPYTPAAYPMLVCDEHSKGCVAFGYTFDEEATAELTAEVEKEQEFFDSLEYVTEKNYNAYEAAQLQRLDEIHDGD